MFGGFLLSGLKAMKVKSLQVTNLMENQNHENNLNVYSKTSLDFVNKLISPKIC